MGRRRRDRDGRWAQRCNDMKNERYDMVLIVLDIGKGRDVLQGVKSFNACMGQRALIGQHASLATRSSSTLTR